jgi:hypothetical protein
MRQSARGNAELLLWESSVKMKESSSRTLRGEIV